MEGSDLSAAPLFVALEGLDGAGTTTQGRRLVERLDEAGVPTVLTREPSDGPIGALIRQMLSRRVVAPDGKGGSEPVGGDVLALLFAADRLDHVDSEVAPNLEQGRCVVTDRYYHSSFAYQGDLKSDGSFDTSWVRRLNERARTPDLTIFLDASAEVCLERMRQRSRRDIYENRSELESLEGRYRQVLEELSAAGEAIERVDAEQPLEEVHEEIFAIVSEWLDEANHPS